MREDELDRVLSRKTEIVPSSGFVGTVMDAVRNEASTPPPLPFPWKRALPGLVACLGLLVWFAVESFRVPERQASAPPIWSTLGSALGSWLPTTETYAAGWILVSILVTLIALKLSMRLAGGR